MNKQERAAIREDIRQQIRLLKDRLKAETLAEIDIVARENYLVSMKLRDWMNGFQDIEQTTDNQEIRQLIEKYETVTQDFLCYDWTPENGFKENW